MDLSSFGLDLPSAFGNTDALLAAGQGIVGQVAAAYQQITNPNGTKTAVTGNIPSGGLPVGTAVASGLPSTGILAWMKAHQTALLLGGGVLVLGIGGLFALRSMRRRGR